MARMTRRARVAAWTVTGPLGHLAAGTADVAVLLWRYWSARITGRSAP